MQPRILYPATLSFRIQGAIKSFQGRQKLKEYVTPKQALQEILRGTLYKKESPKKQSTKTETTDNMMTLNSYLSVVTLNVNGLNDPIKRHRESD